MLSCRKCWVETVKRPSCTWKGQIALMRILPESAGSPISQMPHKTEGGLQPTRQPTRIDVNEMVKSFFSTFRVVEERAVAQLGRASGCRHPPFGGCPFQPTKRTRVSRDRSVAGSNPARPTIQIFSEVF